MTRPFRVLLLTLALVIGYFCAPASGQAWGVDQTWTQYPITPAIRAVRDAIEAGKCREAAAALFQSRGFPSGVGGEGYWPGDSGTHLFWYGKGGRECDGKYQYARGGDGPYTQGWEITWGVPWTPGVPADERVPRDATGHPTFWTIKPIGGDAAVNRLIPIPADPSMPSPTPTPTPTPQPSPTTGACDLSGLQTRLDACLAKITDVGTALAKHEEESAKTRTAVARILADAKTWIAAGSAILTYLVTRWKIKPAETPPTGQ